jgi:hypothetical protein
MILSKIPFKFEKYIIKKMTAKTSTRLNMQICRFHKEAHIHLGVTIARIKPSLCDSFVNSSLLIGNCGVICAFISSFPGFKCP